ncbi:MAG: amino acid adenylation domain-containing protein, partial [Exilibacterium sp.]
SRMAKTLPDKDALVTFNGSLTYKVLDDWSAAIAGHLRRAKITRGDLVAVVADRSRELVAATLGILKAGAAYVPVDPGLPSERIHYMLANSQASVVLTQSRYKNSLCWPDETKLFCIESVAIEDTSPPAVEINSDDLAYVIYTSGSTGQPKGVMIDHCGAMNTILDVNKRFEVGPKDRMLGVSSFGFDLSVYDLFGTLAAGATLVYPDPQATLNPAHWLEVLQAEAITIWNSAPPLMRLLVETAQRQNTTLPRLRLVLLSGDWIPTDLPDAIKAIAPSAKVISLGGATEASIWSIYYPIEKVEPNWCSIPYGYALTNQGWCIRDSVGRDTPLWTSGELYITGVGLAKGYWRDQQKTAHSFIEDSPVCSAENASEIQMRRLYRTGDRGRYLPDGSIEFMGRVDSQVKIQGHRIELGEVEAVLQEHPLVEQAVVLAPGERHNRQLVAYVELSTRVFDSLSASEPVPQLQNFLKQKLPNYMVPAQWTVMDALPLSNNGKVDRKALTRVETATPTYESSSQAAIAPRTETEKGLAAIWEEVLQRENIGVNEDFFELGGQSFDAVRSLALIKERFGESLSLGHIWQARSIENLARHIDGNDAEASLEVLVAIETKGRGRPCFLVHPAGGQVMAYLPLAQRLPQSVYGFVAFAREDDLEAQWDIKQLASRYIEEMRRVQPQGPYTIGGWSSGGVIAFEMATQLENMRQSVDPVWMLDCPAPLQHEPISEQNMLCGFIEDLGQGLPLDLLADPSLSNLHGIKRLQCAIELYNRQRKLDLDVSQLTRIYSVFNNIVQAVRRYRPTKICADIQVIRARDGCVSEFADHPCDHVGDWGWKRLTTGSVRSAFVPGSHYSFLNEPQVNEVAVILSGNNSDAVTEIKKFA